MKDSIFILLLIFISHFSYGQNEQTHYMYLGSINYNSDEYFGGLPCHTKYREPAKYETITNRYAIYTGDQSIEDVDLEIKSIQTIAPKYAWVEKMVQNAYSNKSKPMSCYVLLPGTVEEITILLDTSQSKNFVLMDMDEEVLIRERGEIEWVEIICANSKYKDLVIYLQNALGMEGYYDGQITEQLDIKTMNALKEYQSDNDLRIGLLDLETCRALGIIF